MRLAAIGDAVHPRHGASPAQLADLNAYDRPAGYGKADHSVEQNSRLLVSLVVDLCAGQDQILEPRTS